MVYVISRMKQSDYMLVAPSVVSNNWYEIIEL